MRSGNRTSLAMTGNTAHPRRRCPYYKTFHFAGAFGLALISAVALALTDCAPAVAWAMHVRQRWISDDVRFPWIQVDWTVAETGTGLGPHTGQGQSVPASKKPTPDVKMPSWMTRLPPWMGATTPKVGSPAWKREQLETERQERELRRAINGVCRGC